jgi:hypothetical protein
LGDFLHHGVSEIQNSSRRLFSIRGFMPISAIFPPISLGGGLYSDYFSLLLSLPTIRLSHGRNRRGLFVRHIFCLWP